MSKSVPSELAALKICANIQVQNVWQIRLAFAIVCVCVCVLVAQLCPILCNLMDCSLPSSSAHGILQARTLEWVAVPFSRGSSQQIGRAHV